MERVAQRDALSGLLVRLGVIYAVASGLVFAGLFFDPYPVPSIVLGVLAIVATRTALMSEAVVAPRLARRGLWLVVGALAVVVVAMGERQTGVLATAVGVAAILCPVVVLAVGRPTSQAGWVRRGLGVLAGVAMAVFVVAPMAVWFALVLFQMLGSDWLSLLFLSVASVIVGAVTGIACAVAIALVGGPGAPFPPTSE